MPIELTIPKISKTMEQATIKEWLVADRTQVAVRQPICRIVTEKAELEIDAPTAGFVHQLAAIGEVHVAGSVIGCIDELDDVVGMTLSAVRQFLEAAELDELGIVAVGAEMNWPALTARNDRLHQHQNQLETNGSGLLRNSVLPKRALITVPTPHANVSGIETAFALSAAGVEVTIMVPSHGLFPGLDAELVPLASMILEAVGITLREAPTGDMTTFDAIVAADEDVADSGVVMLRTVPEIGWVGVTEIDAAATHNVVAEVVDLQVTPRSVVLGQRVGLLKVIADRATGQILGVHVIGGETREILATTRLAISGGLSVHDIAAIPFGPASALDSLIAAALGLSREIMS